jgi:hypothetical protein
MKRGNLNRLAGVLAVAAVVGALAAAALAAQPKGGGFYGGTFSNGKNYVAFFVRTNSQITMANVQYQCKGKPVVAATGKGFKPRKVSTNGEFVIAYKATIRRNDVSGKRIGTGRARIVGHFVSRTKAVGTARVKSTKCPKAKQSFSAHGPQIEG